MQEFGLIQDFNPNNLQGVGFAHVEIQDLSNSEVGE